MAGTHTTQRTPTTPTPQPAEVRPIAVEAGVESCTAAKYPRGENGERQHDASAVGQRLRFALVHALENYPPESTAQAVLESVACVIDFTDAVDCAAYRVAETAILAIVSKQVSYRDAVRAWDKQRRGCASADTLTILEIAEAVELTAHLYGLSEGEIGRKAALVELRAFLSRRFGARVANLHDLEDWIGRHHPSHVRGKLTTAGIVARIIHEHRLLGARGEDLSKTLRRVDRDLSRLAGGWVRVARESPLPKRQGRRRHSFRAAR